jgi:Spy/CpxP family protein refolding chaperone
MNRRSMLWGLGFGIVGALGVAGVHRVAFADESATAACAGHAEGMGPHAWIASALSSVELRADQHDAIERLKTDMAAQAAPIRTAHEQVMEAIAVSVEAGAFDHDRIDPLVSATEAAALAQRPAMEEAANRLHAILDADQRQALVTHMREQMQGRMHHHGMGSGHDPMAQIGAELGLTEDQISTIHAKFEALHDGERDAHPHGFGEMRDHFAHMKALADAFVSDSFDAHALGLGEHMGTMMPAFAQRHLARIEAALPVLTPAQRTQLAQMIRSKHLEQILHG